MKFIFQKIFLSLLAMVTVVSFTHAQEQRNVAKLGLVRGSNYFTPAMLAYEHAIGSRFSMQSSVAFGFKNYKGVVNQFARRKVFNFGTAGRFYVLLRRGHLLSGVYAGAFLYYEHQVLYYPIPGFPPLATQTSATIGIPIGYQHAFWQGRIRLDAGLKTGYRFAGRFQSYYEPSGYLSYYYYRPRQIDFFVHLQVGYAF